MNTSTETVVLSVHCALKTLRNFVIKMEEAWEASKTDYRDVFTGQSQTGATTAGTVREQKAGLISHLAGHPVSIAMHIIIHAFVIYHRHG